MGTTSRLVLVVALAVLAMASATQAAEVRPDHPRMLFNADDLPAIRERCQTTHKETWELVKNYADSRLDFQPEARSQPAVIPPILGFVYQVTGDEKYARAAAPLLRYYVDYHLDLVRKGAGSARWDAVSLRRNNHIAYDWLYPALTPEERQEIGRMLLEIAKLHEEKDTWNHAYAGGYNRYENDFYCGLALYKSGVDDAKAEEYIKSGFDFLLNQTVAGRNQVATDDGGIQSGMGYASYNYIPVEAHFVALWKSATGEDLFEQERSLHYFPVWALYTITPNFEAPPICDIGVSSGVLTAEKLEGNTRMSSNFLRLYLALVANRYRDGRAAGLMPDPGNYWYGSGPRFILWSDPAVKPIPPGPELPRGRHFEGLGWVAMRSGWDPDATYSIFTCGDYYYGHKHFDVNHFVIYKKGYLAADARQRIYDTIGHNTLLVYSDSGNGEQRRPWSDKMVRHQDPIVPECDMGDIVAFETNPYYVYTCGDGTKAYNWLGEGEYKRGNDVYHPQLESFTRQYVYLLPDTFVVYDRAVSVKPEARKVWQLHSWTEPEVGEGRVITKQGEGQLTCITLRPERPVIKKQLQELTGSEGTRADIWQVTMARQRAVKKEDFLHVLHVTDAAHPTEATVERIDGDGSVGAAVVADGLTYRVTFRTTGPVGGHVTVTKGNDVLIDKDLTTEVQPQKGYAIEQSQQREK